MTAIGRYWHTLRYLRPVQFWGRLWFYCYRPRPRLDPAPGIRPLSGQWLSCRRKPSLLDAETFRFLNCEGRVSQPDDWQRRDRSLLWLYHLHYFDDLNAEGAEARSDWHRVLIRRWIEDNPPARGVGWAPYPTSLRIVNWIKWHLSGQALTPEALHSLAIQARWLRSRLETHLLGNHLWANAKALVFAGSFFEGDEADAWRRKGLTLVRRELAEQILADGGHFERSPMYHAIVLEGLFDLLQLAHCYPAILPDSDVARWGDYVEPMWRWLERMSHPDGGIAFFNDATLDVAPNAAALNDYAAALGLREGESADAGLVVLEESGYVRLENEAGVLLCDVGAIGPDYLPGHAHADTLSFELSVFGQRFIVNSGIDRYGVSEERLRQRGTGAHSTVVVDGRDSSEVWSGFRVARRARPFDLQVDAGSDGGCVACSHDGYHRWLGRLAGKVTHRRRWRMNAEALIVHDTLLGRYREAEARYHFHPQVNVRLDSSGQHGIAELPDGRCIHLIVVRGKARLAESSYHPEFGIGRSNTCLVIAAQRDEMELKIDYGSTALN